MNELSAELARDRLTWWPERGIGYYPVAAKAEPYDQKYFERVTENAASDIGRKLMQFRCEFVAKYHRGEMLDIGIGSGAFIERRIAQGFATFGYDVNPIGVAWLRRRGLFIDPCRQKNEAASFWDVLEHIDDFRPMIANVSDWLFLSLPIFKDATHVLRSKHFRPTEHVWYFSRDGLVRLMADLNFRLVEYSDAETKIGREDIESFAFRRTA